MLIFVSGNVHWKWGMNIAAWPLFHGIGSWICTIHFFTLLVGCQKDPPPASRVESNAVVGQRFLEFSLYGCKHCTNCTWSIGTKCRRTKQLHATTSVVYGYCILIDDQLGLLDVTCLHFLCHRPFFWNLTYHLNRHIWKEVHFPRPILFLWYLC